MSMVPTFVQSKEGNWYRNPVVKGDGWFICWDDDEPIELVVDRDKSTIWQVLELLRKDGWHLKKTGRAVYNKRSFDGVGFKDAVSCFLKQVLNGPLDRMIDLSDGEKLKGKPKGEGVLYYNGPNGWES